MIQKTLACASLCRRAFILSLVAFASTALAGAVPAEDILQETGIQGGLIVHVNCGDGKWTAELRPNDRYLVHGLDTDSENVKTARRYIQSRRLYGAVSVDRFDGKRLPYINNTVNLVFAEDLGDVTMGEVTRVLAPEGVAYISKGEQWTKTVKPRPKEIDAWTHYMHGPDGNAVAQDTVIAPVGRLQWHGGPMWSRHHEHMSSVSALVTSGKRLFMIFDEAPRFSILTPPQWKLIARDAFNGKVLWKREIPKWFNHLMGLKAGPAILPRRLVAVGERVYVTLRIDAPLTALDAATGKTVQTYKGTDAAQELIVSDGMIFLVAKKSFNKPIWEIEERRLMAVEAETGKILWQKDQKITPLTLAADANKVCFHDGEEVVCLDRRSGRQLWTSEPLPQKQLSSNKGPTLVVQDDVVLFGAGTITAISDSSGKTMWSTEQPSSGYCSPSDMFVIDGLVLGGYVTGGRMNGAVKGFDLKTGKVKIEFPPDVINYWFHHRCHRGKASANYLMVSRTGVELIDFRKKHWHTHHWLRGACLYGIMPANGLIYAPQHPCSCYPEAKQRGFSALAPATATQAQRSKGKKDDWGYPTMSAASPVPEPNDADRLETGPAYDADIDEANARQDDWPTFRGDMTRSGATKARLSARLKPEWEQEIGGRLSTFTVAEGKLLVASVSRHTVYALDAATGKLAWTYTAGGPVDCPPTIYQGRAIFGSRDGYVYCLRLSDGELIWRFRVAPADRRLVAFEKIESVWPVHGSVLLLEDRVYCVAGRSMFLDGGLRMVQLDPKTGRKIAEAKYDDRHPETGVTLQRTTWGMDMPVALPRTLSSDGRNVFMGSQLFDLSGKREGIMHRPADENQAARQKSRWDRARYHVDPPGKGIHLLAPYGFLDDSYHHRSYWVYGRGYDGGWKQYGFASRTWPCGKILVVGDQSVYGFEGLSYGWGEPIEYQLFGDVKPEPRKRPWIEHVRDIENPDLGRKPREHRWVKEVPMLVRCMVLADDTLFIAGPPEFVDENAASEKLKGVDKELDRVVDLRAELARQNDAWYGKMGSLLWAVSTTDGRKLAEYKLDALPVFDTMVAANGRLYFSTTDGKVRCYAAK